MTQENTHYLDLDLGVVTAKKRRRFGRFGRRFEEDSHGWVGGWIHTSVFLSVFSRRNAGVPGGYLPVTDTRGTTHRTRDTDTVDDDLNTRDASVASVASALSHSSLNSFIHSFT